MKDIENHVVVRWAPQWRELGRQLNIADHLMSIIEHDNHNDCEACCSKMLSNWLEQNTFDNATWDVLIDALAKLPENLTGIISCTHKGPQSKKKSTFTNQFPYHCGMFMVVSHCYR